MAYLDFGFIEPARLVAIERTAKDGLVAHHGLDSHLSTRVPMDVRSLMQRHQQIPQVSVGLRMARPHNKKP